LDNATGLCPMALGAEPLPFKRGRGANDSKHRLGLIEVLRRSAASAANVALACDLAVSREPMIRGCVFSMKI
jgi:hypothetical protein